MAALASPCPSWHCQHPPPLLGAGGSAQAAPGQCGRWPCPAHPACPCVPPPGTCGPEVSAGVDLDLGRLAAVLGEVEVHGGSQRGSAEQEQEAAQRHRRPGPAPAAAAARLYPRGRDLDPARPRSAPGPHPPTLRLCPPCVIRAGT